MFKYIVRRILYFIPTLFAIVLLAFIIDVNAPGDPVDRLTQASQGTEMNVNSVNQVEQKKFWTQKLGLDLPVFYLSIHSLAYPDTLYKVFDRNERYALSRLVDEYGNWENISVYYRALMKLDELNKTIAIDSTASADYSKEDISEALNNSTMESRALRSCWDNNVIVSKIAKLKKIFSKYPFFRLNGLQLARVEKDYEDMKDNPAQWKNYIPAISFYGNNQFHRWVFGDGNMITGAGSTYSKGIIRGDFGTSYTTREPIGRIISKRIGWSLFFSLFSVLLAYIVSIPIGIRSAVRKNKAFDVVSSVVLYLLFSMPVFWLATMLLMTFSNPEALWIFPASGVKPVAGLPEGTGLIGEVGLMIPYLILPLVCYTYSSVAFLSRTVRSSVLEVLPMDFIRTARAKGLPENKVIHYHVFKNTLIPLITVFANVFPLAIGGSVIIETIFSIPGMGFEAYNAILSQNYPMIVAIFTITGFFTLLGYLIADILYSFADPRIRF